MQKKLFVLFAAGLLSFAAFSCVHAANHPQEFGHQVVTGDFNNDGYDDLAVGNPSGDVTGVVCGSVAVFYGSASGLSEEPRDVWVQDGAFFPNGKLEDGDDFGYALAGGDLNGDRYDDLAIGAPGEDLTISGENRTDAGVVNVLYGSKNGLVAANAQTWYQSQSDLPGLSENNDRFGMALVIGDFDNDGYGDLAVGAPQEDVGDIGDMGAVLILRGSSNGLTSTNVAEWHQNIYSVTSIGRAGEMFGFSLVSGDFNADGIDDLAVGAPYDMVTTTNGNGSSSGKKANSNGNGNGNGNYKPSETGAVNVFYGSNGAGLRTDNDQWWHQNKKGVEALAEKDDLFGWALAAGDFNGDHVCDLAIGIPGENLKNKNNVQNSGSVEVLFGQAGIGLSAANDQFRHQASGIQSIIENHDYFGSALASGDFNFDGVDDLAVGVPGEDVGKINDAGLVNVLYGAFGTGLTTVGNQVWHQNKNGIKGSADNQDAFGSALAAGDFDGLGPCDLAIGTPFDNEDGNLGGSVNVLYGKTPDGLSDELDQLLVVSP